LKKPRGAKTAAPQPVIVSDRRSRQSNDLNRRSHQFPAKGEELRTKGLFAIFQRPIRRFPALRRY
jgi:hypothetical protein